MKRHHYRVVNPIRFFVFILICVMVIAFAASTVINSSKAEAASVSTYLQVEVTENDTLWGIAEENCTKNMDLRDYVSEICETNDIEASDGLQPGQILFVPIY